MSATKTRTEQDRAQREQAAEKRQAKASAAEPSAEKTPAKKPEPKTWNVLTDANSDSPVFKFTVTASAKKEAEHLADSFITEQGDGSPVKILTLYPETRRAKAKASNATSAERLRAYLERSAAAPAKVPVRQAALLASTKREAAEIRRDVIEAVSAAKTDTDAVRVLMGIAAWVWTEGSRAKAAVGE